MAFLKKNKPKEKELAGAAQESNNQLPAGKGKARKEQTIKAQQKLIAQQKLLQWVTFGASGALLYLLQALYRSYKSKMRVNKTLKNLNAALRYKNAQLGRRNAEAGVLLKEIHHRVKNNLEIVSSLLALQSDQITDQNTKEAILKSQNRVQSIGMVHQKLYQGANPGAIEMKDYFINLSESILETFGAEKRVMIECVMEKLEIDIDTAVPIGLIVNELLTNTLKYAFPGGRDGKVAISLVKKPGGRLFLEVSDNGVGKSSTTSGTGFGGQLVSLLTRQLKGKMKEEVNNGTHTFFEFDYALAV